MILHRVAHWFGWNRGYVVSALDQRGTVWIGYKCVICGKIGGIHAAHSQTPPESAFKA